MEPVTNDILQVSIKDEYVRDKSVISRHIKNALEDELDNEVVAKFATTSRDGKTYIVDYYNLDMIISIGYCVENGRQSS